MSKNFLLPFIFIIFIYNKFNNNIKHQKIKIMAKSSRGGLTNYEKQDQIYSQFQRINRKAAWEKRNPHLTEETQVEQLIRQGKEAKAKYAATAKEKSEKVFISMYNPNNPLNGSSSWSKEQWAEYKSSQK